MISTSFGIVGFGSMGKLIAQITSDLLPDSLIKIYEPNKNQIQDGFEFHNLEETLQSDFLVLAVPTSALESISKEVYNKIPQTTTIISISAMLEYSESILKKYFSNNSYLISHPLFGPKTYEVHNNSIQGFEVVISNASNVSDISLINKKLQSVGVKCIFLNSSEHDKSLAKNHFIPLLLSHTLKDFEFPSPTILTNSAKNLGVFLDSTSYNLELIRDYMLYNSYSNKELENFKFLFDNILKKLN